MNFKKSPWITHLDVGGCNGCMLEIVALKTPRYDIERFGCLFRPSARHADILIISGMVNRQNVARLKTVYEQMAPEKKVIAVGSCAISGGPFATCYNFVGPLDEIIPVGTYVPGCPPRPESIIKGLLAVLKNDEGKRKTKKI